MNRKIHYVMHNGRLACGTHKQIKHMGVLGYPAAEFDAEAPADQCARCAAKRAEQKAKFSK